MGIGRVGRIPWMGQESWDRGVGMGEARRFGEGVGEARGFGHKTRGLLGGGTGGWGRRRMRWVGVGKVEEETLGGARGLG